MVSMSFILNLEVKAIFMILKTPNKADQRG